MAILNPPASTLGHENALVSGRAMRRGHYVPPFVGPLSLKMVVGGEAVWQTDDGIYHVAAGRALILNKGQKYTLTIEPAGNVETLCAFFRDGFVEDVLHGYGEADFLILDDPEKPLPTVRFLETLRPVPARALQDLSRLRRALVNGEADTLGAEETFGRVALELLDSETALRRRAACVPAARAATRAETLRRLSRARDFIEAGLAEPLSLGMIARAACLSPFHCHRLFTAFFGETPHAYLTRRRLERADDLLTRSDGSVTSVCFNVGFTSLGSFSNLFRRRFGVSPSAHRKREKGKIR